MKSCIVQIEFDDREGDYYIQLPEEMLKALAELGWTLDDDLEWIDNEDGTFLLKKKEA